MQINLRTLNVFLTNLTGGWIHTQAEEPLVKELPNKMAPSGIKFKELDIVVMGLLLAIAIIVCIYGLKNEFYGSWICQQNAYKNLVKSGFFKMWLILDIYGVVFRPRLVPCRVQYLEDDRNPHNQQAEDNTNAQNVDTHI